jgi:hypothetical protein
MRKLKAYVHDGFSATVNTIKDLHRRFCPTIHVNVLHQGSVRDDVCVEDHVSRLMLLRK